MRFVFEISNTRTFSRYSIRFDSIRSDPIRSDPIRSDPIRSDPIRSDPIRSDPIRSDPIRSDPIRSDPIRSDPNIENLQLCKRISLEYFLSCPPQNRTVFNFLT